MHAFGVVSINLLPNPRAHRFSPMLSLRIFIVLHFTLSSKIHLSFFKKIYLFIYLSGCIGSSLLCVGFLYLQRAGATLRCGGFSCCGAQVLGVRASVAVARGLSNCGSRSSRAQTQ